MTATLNGKPQRKQLSDQLDRLDTIIDALAEALPEAVADATRDGTRQAMREVLMELLTDPELQARLRTSLVQPVVPEPIPQPIAPMPVETKPSLFARLKSSVRNGCRKITTGISSIWSRTAEKVNDVMLTTRAIRSMLPMSRFVTVAFGACVVVAILSYALPHTASAIISGIGGACTAMCVQVGVWFKRYATALGFNLS
jgi:hypothetical protein